MKKNTDAMPPYSLVNNILYIIKKTWKLDKRLLLGSVIKIPVTVLIPLATTYLSGAVVRLITENESAEKMLLTVVSFSALLLFLNTTNIYSGIKLSFRSLGVKFSFITLCSSKSMDLDYDIIEDPDGQVKMQRGAGLIGGRQQRSPADIKPAGQYRFKFFRPDIVYRYPAAIECLDSAAAVGDNTFRLFSEQKEQPVGL